MQHPIGAGTPEPNPEDIARGLAELERHLAEQPPATPAALVVSGETKRVAALRKEVAEAEALIDLQDNDAPFLIDTPKVRAVRRRAQEAARLHQLAQDPTMRAWQASRMRRLLVIGAMFALALAIAWSTVGVQKFAADGAPIFSPAWVIAWLVEPFLSLALMVVVGARAYVGANGQPIVSTTLQRIEWLFLLLTLGMNAWPYLPGIAETFSMSQLMLHMLGPIVTVAIVTALPIILAAFANLDHGATSRGATGRSTGQTSAGGKIELDRLVAKTRALIAAEVLPVDPSATAIRKALGGSTDTARDVRDELRKGGAA